MEDPSGLGLGPGSSALTRDNHEEIEPINTGNIESETAGDDIRSNHHFHSMTALEILRESVRILRFNLTGFMAILAVLICPVSAVVLSNVLVDQSLVKRLSLRLLLVAKSSGLPLKPFIKQVSHKLAEMVVSVIVCFPLFVTLSLLSKAAVVYSVDCTYSRKKFDSSKFYVFICKIWKRIVFTYICGGYVRLPHFVPCPSSCSELRFLDHGIPIRFDSLSSHGSGDYFLYHLRQCYYYLQHFNCDHCS